MQSLIEVIHILNRNFPRRICASKGQVDNISHIARYSVAIASSARGLREEESNRRTDRKSTTYIHDSTKVTCTLRNTGMFKFYRERFRASTLWDCVSMKNVYMY